MANQLKNMNKSFVEDLRKDSSKRANKVREYMQKTNPFVRSGLNILVDTDRNEYYIEYSAFDYIPEYVYSYIQEFMRIHNVENALTPRCSFTEIYDKLSDAVLVFADNSGTSEVLYSELYQSKVRSGARLQYIDWRRLYKMHEVSKDEVNLMKALDKMLETSDFTITFRDKKDITSIFRGIGYKFARGEFIV